MSDMNVDVVNKLLSLGAATVAPISRPDGGLAVIVPDGCSVELLEDSGVLPRFVEEKARLHDRASFAQYVNTFKREGTVLVADSDAETILACLDYHEKDVIHHNAHKAVYPVPHSLEWQTWQRANERNMDQVTFAEFIEENRRDILDPDAATLLEMVTQLQIKRNLDFTSTINLANGTQRLTANEDEKSTAGKSNIDLPTQLRLALAVYRGEERDVISAYLRTRMVGNKPTFFVKLDRPDQVALDAFDRMCAAVAADIGLTVLRGDFR